MPGFTEELRAQADAPRLRKGERTRRRIRWACAAALHEAPYAALSVDAICARADVSRTAFYVYYPTKAELAREVLTDFQRSVMAVVRRGAAADPLAKIEAANRAYLAFVRANAPLMERVRELRDEIPELIAERQRVNAELAAQVVRSARRHGTLALAEDAALLRAHAAIFMVEDTLREVFVIGNPNLRGLAEDQDLLVRELSQAWHRALY